MKQHSFCYSLAQIACMKKSFMFKFLNMSSKMGQKYGTQSLKISEGLGPSLYLKEKLLLVLLKTYS